VCTKRQVKPFSQDGILRPRDANRSIKQRKGKEIAANKRRIDQLRPYNRGVDDNTARVSTALVGLDKTDNLGILELLLIALIRTVDY
jgi:hypothetical protein